MKNIMPDTEEYQIRLSFFCDDGKEHILRFSDVDKNVEARYINAIVRNFIEYADLFDPKPVSVKWGKLVTIKKVYLVQEE